MIYWNLKQILMLSIPFKSTIPKNDEESVTAFRCLSRILFTKIDFGR